jgi:hypothetical protein
MIPNSQQRDHPNDIGELHAIARVLEELGSTPLLQGSENSVRSDRPFLPNLPGSIPDATSKMQCFVQNVFDAGRGRVCALASPNSPKTFLRRTRGITSSFAPLKSTRIGLVAPRLRLFLRRKMLPRLFCRGRLSPLYECRKVGPDGVRHAEHQFKSRIAQTAFNQAEHGLRDPGTVAHHVIRQLPTRPVSLHKPDQFPANSLIMSNIGHVGVLQKKGLDSYFAIVKYTLHVERAANRRSSHAVFEGKSLDKERHTSLDEIDRDSCLARQSPLRNSFSTGGNQRPKLGNQAQHRGEIVPAFEHRELFSPSQMKIDPSRKVEQKCYTLKWTQNAVGAMSQLLERSLRGESHQGKYFSVF